MGNEAVLRFWLDKGVDGFRVDAIEKLYADVDVTLNEPVSGLNVTPFQYEYLDHIYTSNQPETNPTIKDWYSVLDEYRIKDGKERYMVIELYGEPALRNKLYETGGNPFNFDLIDVSTNPTGFEIRDKILNEYDNLPIGKWPNFVLGNHDRRRVSHKFGPLYVDAYNMLLLTLWGTPTTYYGEEIGMREAYLTWAETVDPWGRNYGPDGYQQFSRDPERTPMQWTPDNQAGFTTGSKTWLPLGENHTTINVQTEQNSKNLTSLQLYKQLAHLRQTPVFQSGTFQVTYVSSNIFSYIREGGGEKYLIIINFGKLDDTVDLTPYTHGVSTLTVVAITPGVQTTTEHSTLNLDKIILKPGDGLVLQIQGGTVVG
uniref:Glycosyl hydrolase family 13 catalytic domain-containing protein n=1 Tax=Arion vulgaris TaxID=1028688 RepID=A0A0B7AWA7_9EUPU